MNEELKLAKGDYKLLSEDIWHIKNGKSFIENFKVSIFGGNADTANRIQQRYDDTSIHIYRVYDLRDKCNCIDRSGPIVKETDSLLNNLVGLANDVTTEKENKGIVGKIMNTISNSQKGRL